MVVLAVIVGFHVLLIIGFANGLVPKIKEMMAPPIETTIIKEVKPKDELPPPPPPEMEHPPVQVVAPEITISISADIPPPPITQVTTNVVPPQPPRPRVAPAPDSLFILTYKPDPSDYYPTAARNGEAGTVRVKLCVDEQGKLTSVELDKTSGFPVLDEAGKKYAHGGLRFKPAMKAGVPVAACGVLPVKFKVNANN
jgi:protein TonB